MSGAEDEVTRKVAIDGREVPENWADFIDWDAESLHRKHPDCGCGKGDECQWDDYGR